MKSTQHLTLASLIGMLLVVLVAGLAVAQDYDLYFAPNPEFDEEYLLFGWMTCYQNHCQWEVTPGTIEWSNEHRGSAHFSVSGAPSIVYLTTAIGTTLYPGDRIIARVTHTDFEATAFCLTLGRFENAELDMPFSQSAMIQDVDAGTEDLILDVNRIFIPGTMLSLYMASWPDDSEAWVHYVRIERGGDRDDDWPGIRVGVGPDADQGHLPTRSLLNAPFPNPTNAGAQIRFNLMKPSSAAMRIYDLHGRLVRYFAAEPYGAGENTVVWDGKSDNEQPVTSGTYFYELEADGQRHIRQAVILR